ncbi:MAG: hypothetical protein QM784_36660 [Polyangiaceae bacterium]
MGRLAAAFNGGFQATHGEYGMMADGVVYLPPKPYAATVAELADGSVGFGTWPESDTISAEYVGFRQNLTPLLADGKDNPYRRTWWAECRRDGRTQPARSAPGSASPRTITSRIFTARASTRIT